MIIFELALDGRRNTEAAIGAQTFVNVVAVTKVTSKPCTARRMIGLERFYSEAPEVLMPDRNDVMAFEPTQEAWPRSPEARVSTPLNRGCWCGE
jgi:hypothetical protein